MEEIRSFVLFYILIGFLMQILGDSKMSRYVRFFSGIVFLLILMAPVYQWFTKEDVIQNISVSTMWQEYKEARDYDLMVSQYENDYSNQTTEVLIQALGSYLGDMGYEIEEYEIFWDEEYNVEELNLYVMTTNDAGITLGRNYKINQELTTAIMEDYQPEFEIVVYEQGE